MLKDDPNRNEHVMEILSKAQGLHRSGKLEEAKHAYLQVMVLKPDSSEALHLLGTLFLQESKAEDGIDYIRRAIAISPRQPTYYQSLGSGLAALHRYEEARKAFDFALTLSPQNPDILNSFGIMLASAGELDASAHAFGRAVVKKPDHFGALYNLAQTLILQRRTGDLYELFDWARRDGRMEEPAAKGLWIIEALEAYRQNDIERCVRALSTAGEFPQVDYTNRPLLNLYLGYLKRLIEYRNEMPHLYSGQGIGRVHIIGGGDVLSLAHINFESRNVLYSFIPNSIIGARIEHLIDERNNRFKEALRIELDSIRRGSVAFYMFGDIDCMPDEGLFSKLKKSPKIAPAAHIAEITRAYCMELFYLSKERGLKGVIVGIPLPKVDMARLPDGDRSLYLSSVRMFNEGLINGAAEFRMTFIDIYHMALNSEGLPNTEQYIDDYHLRPEFYMDRFSHILLDLAEGMS